jgi:hypothetical protein
MKDLPVNAPPSLEAHQRRPRAGADTRPATISPASSSAISVAQTGTPRTKFDVPSIGSMIQRRSWDPVEPSTSPCSSPSTTSRVRVDLSCRRMVSSTAWSDSVTYVMSGLVETARSMAPNRSMERLSALSASTCASRTSSFQECAMWLP